MYIGICIYANTHYICCLLSLLGQGCDGPLRSQDGRRLRGPQAHVVSLPIYIMLCKIYICICIYTNTHYICCLLFIRPKLRWATSSQDKRRLRGSQAHVVSLPIYMMLCECIYAYVYIQKHIIYVAFCLSGQSCDGPLRSQDGRRLRGPQAHVVSLPIYIMLYTKCICMCIYIHTHIIYIYPSFFIRPRPRWATSF